MGPFSLELSYFRSLNEIKRLLRPLPLFCAIILRYTVELRAHYFVPVQNYFSFKKLKTTMRVLRFDKTRL